MLNFAILKIHGNEKHQDVGRLLYYQAFIYSRRASARQGGCLDFNKVQMTYNRALAILEATLGNDHKRTMNCRRKLDKLTGSEKAATAGEECFEHEAK
jgi:hypothetical protein